MIGLEGCRRELATPTGLDLRQRSDHLKRRRQLVGCYEHVNQRRTNHQEVNITFHFQCNQESRFRNSGGIRRSTELPGTCVS